MSRRVSDGTSLVEGISNEALDVMKDSTDIKITYFIDIKVKHVKKLEFKLVHGRDDDDDKI